MLNTTKNKMARLTNDRSTGIYVWMCQSIQIHTAYTIKILEGDNTDDTPGRNKEISTIYKDMVPCSSDELT